jgi:nucleotide-binding universal stress UspA family protein
MATNSPAKNSSPAVVVGIDGSRWSVDAALWAAAEAACRDLPLRLLYVIEPRDDSELTEQHAQEDLACAHVSVRRTVSAVEAQGGPVKIEWEIVAGKPSRILQDASRSAELVCVGAMGIAHATGQRLGSTSGALSTSAHCPLAIIRGDQQPSGKPGSVVVEIDERPDNARIFDIAIGEARLRGVPLTVLVTTSTGRLQARAQLDRRIAEYRSRYPDVEFDIVVVRGSTMNHLDHHADSIQTLVVGQHRAAALGELLGRAPGQAQHRGDYTVLIGEHRGRH